MPSTPPEVRRFPRDGDGRRVHWGRLGDVAQLGERRLCKPEVAGSIPVVSTTRTARRDTIARRSRRTRSPHVQRDAERQDVRQRRAVPARRDPRSSRHRGTHRRHDDQRHDRPRGLPVRPHGDLRGVRLAAGRPDQRGPERDHAHRAAGADRAQPAHRVQAADRAVHRAGLRDRDGLLGRGDLVRLRAAVRRDRAAGRVRDVLGLRRMSVPLRLTDREGHEEVHRGGDGRDPRASC